jgi:CheY-like chemotaxis protein
MRGGATVLLVEDDPNGVPLAWRRDRPPLDRIPTVVLTSSRESTDVTTAYQQGANSYLVKPVSYEATLEMMKTINVYWLAMNERPDLRAGGPAAG